jgi:hypothetical protein
MNHQNPLQQILEEIKIEIEMFETFINSKHERLQFVLEAQAKMNHQSVPLFVISRKLEYYERYNQVEKLIAK